MRAFTAKLAFIVLAIVMHAAHGEGTFEIRAGSGANSSFAMESSRPGVNQQSDLNLPRITYLKVDIRNRNERIDVYTSVVNNVAPGGAPLDVALWCPGNAPDEDLLGNPDLSGHANDYLSADATRNAIAGGAGNITNWNEVVAVQNVGSRPRPPVSFNLRNLCPQRTGTYTLRLYGDCCSFARPVVEFFDVAVRRGSNIRRGRLWTNHIALLARDGFSGRLETELFVVAGSDNGSSYTGHVWRVDANGIQPFGFHFFANQTGAEPGVHHDRSVRNSASPTPIMRPQYPIYFNRPRKTVNAPTPPTLSNFEFSQSCNGGTPTGGDFSFQTSLPLDYQLAIDENGDGTYQVSEVFLTGTASAGTNTVNWDGTFADGTPVPSGTQIDVRISIESGEVHLPFYDVENQLNPTGPLIIHDTQNTASRALYFWDDRPVGGGASPTEGTLTPHSWNNALGNVSIIDTWKFSELLTSTTVNVYGATCTVDGGVEGAVYSDANHNGVFDAGESGISGVNIVLRDTAAGTCVEAVTNGTGAYSFANVAPGNYELIEAAQEAGSCPASGSDPPGHVSTTANVIPITVAQTIIPQQNFGDFNGARVSGLVLEDNGTGGGAAHDAVANGAEQGIANVNLLVETAPAGSALDAGLSAGDGSFVVWVPAGSGAVVLRAGTNSGMTSVSAAPGSTGGVNPGGDLDALQFTAIAGTDYSGVVFGDVRMPAFAPEHVRTIAPGTVTFYPHTLTGYTDGVVTFSVENAVETPSIAGWAHAILSDDNCNASIDAGESVITGPVSVDADTSSTRCILVRVMAPSAAPVNAQYQIAVRADFDYTGSGAPNTTVDRIDLTIVGATAQVGLELLKSVDKATALPGETLTYTVSYSNTSAEALTDIVILDVTPAFTTYLSGQCTVPLPPALSSCSLTAEPAVGGSGPIEWSFGGALNSSAAGSVQFQVVVDQ